MKTGQLNLLDKAIASAASALIFLELNEIEFAKRLKNILEIGFVDAEVNVSDIQPMERNRIMVSPNISIRVASLSIFLSLSQLGDNGDS